jgi:hypothetical protein
MWVLRAARINAVGAVPAPPITNFRLLFVFSPSTNYAGPSLSRVHAHVNPVTKVRKIAVRP